MGETELRGNIMQGDGVYKSSDAGKLGTYWFRRYTCFAKIRVHPEDSNILYVAALGHPYGDNKQRGVFKSIDGGLNWKKTL